MVLLGKPFNYCAAYIEKAKYFPSIIGAFGGTDLRLISLHPNLQNHGYKASASCGMPVYSLAFAGTQ